MLLHDVSIPLSLNIWLVGVVHYISKCNSRYYIVYFESFLFAMAEGDKRVISDRSTLSRPPQNLNLVGTSSTSLHPDSQSYPVNAVQGDPAALVIKKKPTSFQITSVTVQGSRLSTDGGDDSADDLDESHTEDLSSDFLDCSRTTDLDFDPLSEESNATNNDAASQSRSVQSVHVTETQPKFAAPIVVEPQIIPTLPYATMQSPVMEAMQNPATEDSALTNSGSGQSSEPSTSTKASVSDQWQHRFKVVKIVSSQPFKRGKWLCMDFMDPPSMQSSEPRQDLPESAPATMVGASAGSQTETMIGSASIQPADNVAHVYEIAPNQSYPGGISVSVCPQPTQQPLYGIFLPLNAPQMSEIPMVPIGFTHDTKVDSQPSTLLQPMEFVQVVQPPPPSSLATTTTIPPTHTYIGDGVPQQQTYVQPPSSIPQQPLPVCQPSSQTLPSVQTVSVSDVTTGTQPQQVITSGPVTPAVSQHVLQPDPRITAQQQVAPTQQAVHQNLPQQSVSQAPVLPSVPQAQVSQTAATPATVMQQYQQQLAPVASVASQTPVVSSSIPEGTNVPSVTPSVSGTEVPNVPSQVLPHNHVDASEGGGFAISTVVTTVATGSAAVAPAVVQPSTETLSETAVAKATSEEPESASSSGNTVAIDNKIEQAMDLVKSHLMFAVREEVDVLKERITELMERISLLEHENSFLKANASHETLSQLTQSQQLQQNAHSQQPSL